LRKTGRFHFLLNFGSDSPIIPHPSSTMKNSIGSLAALAAFAAPALVHATPAESDIRAAAFADVALSYFSETPIAFDIDNDGNTDFTVFANTSTSVRVQMAGGTEMTIEPVDFGSTFNLADAQATIGVNVFEGSDSYYGFDFVSGFDSQHHAAWVHFDFSGESPVVVNGGWEAESFFTSITVGAIPEPSAAGALTGAAALLGACGFRRRRTA
jgi:hypothetical protein